MLQLDGGDGYDSLAIRARDLPSASPLTVIQRPGGGYVTSFGRLANWEEFQIVLGAMSGNRLALGAGDDVVYSTGGRDRMRLGAGLDLWEADYSKLAGNFTMEASAGTASIKVGDNVFASAEEVETVNLTMGAGDNSAFVREFDGDISGMNGTDLLRRYATTGNAVFATLVTDAQGLVTGHVSEQNTSRDLEFDTFEKIGLAGSDQDDLFVLRAKDVALADEGYVIVFEGAEGEDRMVVDLSKEAGGATVDATATDFGAGKITWGTSSNLVGWSAIESLSLTLGAGDDWVDVTVARDLQVFAGAGSDVIDFGALQQGIGFRLGYDQAQSLDGGSYIILASGFEQVVATEFADTLYDGAGSDLIDARGGNDFVYSAADSTGGADRYFGDAGNDRISYYYATSGVTVSLATTLDQATGGGGTDALSGFEDISGSTFGDRLTGGDAANALFGDAGDDTLEGLGGDDQLYGGDGSDTASYANSTAAVTVSLAVGGAQNTVGAGSDFLSSIENLTGSAFADTLRGSTGNNRITGGLGRDVMTGGGGLDTFVFRSVAESSASARSSDTITDFVGPGRGGGDLIDLSAIDGNVTNTSRADAFTFIGTAAFSGVAGQLHYAAAGTGQFFVSGDVNGDRVADFGIYVQTTDTTLAARDFVL